MTDNDLRSAIEFLQRISVGRLNEQRLIDTVDALFNELQRRTKQRERHKQHDSGDDHVAVTHIRS